MKLSIFGLALLLAVGLVSTNTRANCQTESKRVLVQQDADGNATTQSRPIDSDGFVDLYNGEDLTGWRTEGNWIPQRDGSILIDPRENERGWGRFKSYLWTKRTYKDFELRVECLYPEKGNSGIYFRVHDRDNPVRTGIETQVFDSSKQQGKLNDHTLGGIIPGIAPSKNLAKPPGQWNRLVIRCVGNQLQVMVNGERVIQLNLQETALKDRKSEGYIGLQDHGVPHSIRFRNIQIKEIKSAKPDEDAQVLFRREVLPIFESKCLDCHGEGEQEGALRLDSLAHIVRGGNSGEPLMNIGDDMNSHLVHLLTTDDAEHRMPLGDDQLTGFEIETIRKWIRVTRGWSDAIAQAKEQKLDHWSFHPIVRPDVPNTGNKNPIDSFVEAKLLLNGLKMSPGASDRQLVRRIYHVLHGLPPTPEQVDAYLADKSQNKWERLVSKALSSPHFGERFAVSWLDLIRFSETDGFEINAERNGAWRFRDWVINAFNQDMPYDRFVTHQLAGDTTGELIATAFLVAGTHNTVVEKDKKGQADNVQNEVSDFLNSTGTTFLGLTLGCARCHNHKFDPVTQSDFYSVQAVFSGVNHGYGPVAQTPERKTELVRIKSEISGLKSRLKPYEVSAPPNEPVNARRNVEKFPSQKVRFVRMTIERTNNGTQGCVDELEIFSGDTNVGLAKHGARPSSGGDFVHPLHRLEHINDGKFGNAFSWISKEVKGWVQIELAKPTQVDRIVWGRDRGGKISDRLATDYRIQVSLDGKTWEIVGDSRERRTDDAQQIYYDFGQVPKQESGGVSKSYDRLKSLFAQESELGKPPMSYVGTFSSPTPTFRLSRGDPMLPKEEVSPNTIAVLGDLNIPTTADGTERRKAFSNWVVSPDNPLTARVMVNRIWQFHFGKGLVDTPSDFGMNGRPPSHPDLLNWLASELIDSGWSTKHIHRLILTSNCWKQSSRPQQESLLIDSSSRLLWRFPPRRLDAESIRDSILATTGKLDRSMGGPGFSGFDIIKENVRHYFPKKNYGPNDWRRMVYMTRVRKEVESVFGVFDCPDGNQGTPERTRSTTPLQALNLLNSAFVMQQSEFFADRLKAECVDSESMVTRSYELCFGRTPNDREMALGLEMIETVGLIQYCRVLLNSNEFVFVL